MGTVEGHPGWEGGTATAGAVTLAAEPQDKDRAREELTACSKGQGEASTRPFGTVLKQ